MTTEQHARITEWFAIPTLIAFAAFLVLIGVIQV